MSLTSFKCQNYFHFNHFQYKFCKNVYHLLKLSMLNTVKPLITKNHCECQSFSDLFIQLFLSGMIFFLFSQVALD